MKVSCDPDLSLEKTWVQLVDQFPFFATILTNFRVTHDSHLPAVAGVYVKNQLAHLKINPEPFLKLSPTIRIGTLEHEVMHVILIHQDRENNRNHMMWNIAADLSINANLVPSKLLPPTCCFYDREPFNFPAGQTAEKYYELIMSDEKKKKKIEQMFGQGCIVLVDDHGVWRTLGDACGLDPELVKEMVRNAAEKTQGNIPGELQHLIDELLKPSKVAWKSVIRSFVNKNVRGEREHSWKRLSRRLPGLVQGRKKSLVPKLFVAVDSSGSISNENLDEFFNEIRHIKKQRCPVHIAVFDVEVSEHYEYEGKDFRQVKGRGGTSFIDVFNLARTMRDVSAIICLTDGYGSMPDTSHNYPETLWCLTKNGCDETAFPFGRILKMDI